MLMWLFTRLSALAMYAFILFAIIGALIMGARTQMNFADLMRWGFTPNVTHVQEHQCARYCAMGDALLESWSPAAWC